MIRLILVLYMGMFTIIQLAQKSKISDQEFTYHYQNFLVGVRLPKSQRFRKSGLLSKLDNRTVFLLST